MWDGLKIHGKIIDVYGENPIWAVDVSPDLGRFATGISKTASIVGALRVERREYTRSVTISPDSTRSSCDRTT